MERQLEFAKLERDEYRPLSEFSDRHSAEHRHRNRYGTTLKNRGVTIAILYIPYQTIINANASFADNEDGYANNNIPKIAPALQACASTNFFYTANSPTDIQNALIAMFQQAVSTAHVSN
jgi:hypothetical protein